MEKNSFNWRTKADRIALSPPAAAAAETTFGPSKLSKEVINEKSFIQIRKKSVDILESPFSTNVVPANSRQRKISNVHFGPVVAEQLSPVPATPNNISASNFGFGEKSKYTDESDDSNDKGEETAEEEEEEVGSSNDSGEVEGEVETEEEVEKKAIDDIRKSLESISSLPSNGGSVRITRHSSRAYTKASEIFQRSNSCSRPTRLTPSISINSECPLLTSPTSEYPRFSPTMETPTRTNSDDDEQPKRPLLRSPNSDSVLPLHQRRQRRTGLEMQVPKADNLSIGGRVTPIRSPSRSPSFSRKYVEKLIILIIVIILCVLCVL